MLDLHRFQGERHMSDHGIVATREGQPMHPFDITNNIVDYSPLLIIQLAVTTVN